MTKKIVLILTLLFASVCLADEETFKKYRDLTPKQAESLPKEKFNSLPMVYMFAAADGMSDDASLIFGMRLNLLMYSGLSDFESAVKSFQKDLGEKQTGELTLWQIHKLKERSDFQKTPSIIFPSDFYGDKRTIGNGSAHVKGAFIMHDEPIGFPVNNVEISCYKSEGTCRLDRLYMKLPNEDDWVTSYFIDKSSNWFKITNWGIDTVEAVSIDHEAACRITTLSLNFKTKEFYSVEKNGAIECVGPKLKKPVVSQIVDGKGIINKEFKALKDKAYSYLSSDFRNKAEAYKKK
jgi:hypothetical protein